ncbi:MAG TPA: L-glutamate gamma-semialdehyde dehydrogenase [bacterium]|nr:L-glutamate gamma-semialdehyde dehydrogenase [bacterium]
MATDSLQNDVRAIGEQIFQQMSGESPSIFKKDYWSGRIMEWSMKDESFKVDMFRFVDVLPVLKSSDTVAQHLNEYFNRPGQNTPAVVKTLIGAAGMLGGLTEKIASSTIRKNVNDMAERFIVGTTGKEAIATLEKLRKEKVTFTVDLLGEACVSEEESIQYQKRYMEILESLVSVAAKWSPVDQVDKGPAGDLPRVNISVKLTALFSLMDPVDWEGSITAVKNRLRPLFQKARDAGAFVNVDMEQYKFKDLTYAIFRSLLDEAEFRNYAHAGVVVQAYLKDSEPDLRDLIAWSASRPNPVTIRLVKGAYWDYETVLAEQKGWPCPVFENKAATDENYEKLTTLLLENRTKIRAAFGSHNVRSIAFAMATAKKLGVPAREVEYQMLYGMAEPIRAALVKMGERVRVYAPVGELLPGMAYLVRRLLENTSNESFLRKGFAENVSHEALLAKPSAPPSVKPAVREGFRNEPHADFSQKSQRDAMVAALAAVKKEFGRTWPLHIDGKDVTSARVVDSLNPARPSEVVGKVCQAGKDEAEKAMAAAKKAFVAWRDTAPEVRADYLRKIAAEMRRRKWELSATMVWETGKNWREADADTGEAIDFCDYYASEMERLGRPRNPRRLGTVPGEHNELFYQARGVGVIISPWNFPLAILTGMTVAGIVAGNTVLIKPAEPSMVIAAKMMDIFKSVKLPPGVANFVPGKGSEIGQYMVEHPDTAFIAFTGSKETGLGIMQAAAIPRKGQRQVKRVIAEMGGKNAVIVDSDADMDEAVLGVVQSAFGYQGQKCSACARVIVLEETYDEFVHRLCEAVKTLPIGEPADPAYSVGPVVDAKSQKKILEYVEIAKKEGKVLVQREIPEAAKASNGYYVGPVVVSEIKPDAVIACEEIFGPVLAVMRAKNFDDALRIATSVEFALTGGVFSRSPANIDKARREFRVGNLYINRGTTGALVERQPFGGFLMSGVGSKAGGPDYLLQFLEPRSITENTLRRGFAPVES